MKPENLRLLAEQIKISAEALTKISQLLCSVAEDAAQLELPITTTIVTQDAPAVIEHSPGYLESKKAAVTETPAPEITRQSLRALAEKLVAKGRLHMVKEELGKFGVATLSALKTENYADVQKLFLTDLGE